MDRAWDSNLENLKWRLILVTSKISFDDQNLRYHRTLIFIRSSKLISIFFQSPYWSLTFYQKVAFRLCLLWNLKTLPPIRSSLQISKVTELIFSLNLPNDTLDFDLQNEYQRSLRLIFSLDLPIRSLDFYYIFKTDLQFFSFIFILIFSIL